MTERSRPAQTRLFLALWPDHAVLQALQDWLHGQRWPPGAAVERPERWHLTLHFIGALPVHRLSEVVQGLRVPFSPFEIEFGRLDHWPHGLVVVAPLALPAPLLELHRQLGEALQRLQLPLEKRAFRPHLTLARKAVRGSGPTAPLRLRWPVREVALVQSDGGYRTVARYG